MIRTITQLSEKSQTLGPDLIKKNLLTLTCNMEVLSRDANDNINEIEEILTEEKIEVNAEEMIKEEIKNNVEEKIENNVEEKIKNNVEEKIENNVEEKIENNVEEKIENNVEEKIENNVEEKIENNVEEKIENNVEEKIENNVEEKIENNVEEKIENNVEEKIENNVEEKIKKCIDQLEEENKETNENGDISHIEKTTDIENKGDSIKIYKKYKFLIWEFETPVIWYSVFFITLAHILAVYFLLTMPYLEKMPLIIYTLIVGGISGFGITGGAHRYFTHKSYKAKTPLKIILLLCYSVAGQNSLLDWVRDHRVHHKFSETDADPHNSHRGFFFSHVGWLMMRKKSEVIRKGRMLDFTDITGDPIIAFHVKYWIFFKLFFCFLLPTSIPPLLWGESWYYSIAAVSIVRYMISLNSTWAVNSFAHLYGNRPYDKEINPVENIAVSFFAMGEGYHNYHHTFPWDYRAAELGQMLNVTTLWLNLFKKIGWAYDLREPSNELVRMVVNNRGDGSHYQWGHEIPESADIKDTRKTQ